MPIRMPSFLLRESTAYIVTDCCFWSGHSRWSISHLAFTTHIHLDSIIYNPNFRKGSKVVDIYN